MIALLVVQVAADASLIFRQHFGRVAIDALRTVVDTACPKGVLTAAAALLNDDATRDLLACQDVAHSSLQVRVTEHSIWYSFNYKIITMKKGGVEVPRLAD